MVVAMKSIGRAVICVAAFLAVSTCLADEYEEGTDPDYRVMIYENWECLEIRTKADTWSVVKCARTGDKPQVCAVKWVDLDGKSVLSVRNTRSPDENEYILVPGEATVRTAPCGEKYP